MKCPQCHTQNASGATECDGCGVVFKDTRRAATVRPDGPQLCTWTEFGRSCPERGIINTGRWLCREHWERSRNLEPAGTGNYPVESQRSLEMHRWDGWYEDWLIRRDRKRQLPNPLPEREPGSDDDFADLVPEEVGQA